MFNSRLIIFSLFFFFFFSCYLLFLNSYLQASLIGPHRLLQKGISARKLLLAYLDFSCWKEPLTVSTTLNLRLATAPFVGAILVVRIYASIKILLFEKKAQKVGCCLSCSPWVLWSLIEKGKLFMHETGNVDNFTDKLLESLLACLLINFLVR